MKAQRWLREPLVHFLLAGAIIFAVLSAIEPAPNGDRTIVIDDALLIGRLQQRTGGDAETLAEALRVMPDDERSALVREIAAEEALVREGRALGLDKVDTVVRLRTAQQMRLLLTEEATADLTVTEEEVADFYAGDSSAYAEPESLSFGHLFYSGDNSEARARNALAGLRNETLSSEGTGDRFLYQSNYADAGAEEVASQFGMGFLTSLAQLEPGQEWQGPIQSDHGWHLVLLRAKQEPRVPPLAEIAPRVREDALAAKRAAALERAVDKLLDRYEVKIQ